MGRLWFLPYAIVEAKRVHVACPKCGTGYALETQVLERPRLKLRCRRCHALWDPRRPLDDLAAEEPAAVAKAPPEPDDGVDKVDDGSDGREPVSAQASETPAVAAATPPKRRARKALTVGAYALALLLLLGGLGGLAYAFKDELVGVAAAMPTIVDVQPEWRGDGAIRHLVVTAKIINPGPEVALIRHVHVKFLSSHGAWIGERLVTTPEIVVQPLGEAAIEVGVDELPQGTASLEMTLVPGGANS